MDQQLTAIVVHDLKNALGALEGELSALVDDLDQDRARQAHASCVALREKMIGFLTLYKASTQGLTTRIEAVSPDDFLNDLLRDRIAAPSELNISINIDDMPAIAFFDEHLVGLALDAALQNATRFASANIVVGCKKIDEEIVFTVQDDGAGLGTTEGKPSTGLGMSLCAAIAEAHRNENRQGSVQLSTPLNGGALFTLRLP